MRGTSVRRWMVSGVVTVAVCANVSTIMGQASEAAGTQPGNDTRQREIADLARALLQTIDQQKIDVAFDGLDDVALKRAAVEAAVSAFSQRLISSAVDQRQYEAICQDYVTYRNATSPRLTGRIVRIGPGEAFGDIAAAALQIKAGDLVLLGEGVFELPEARRLPPRLWSDIAIVGRSPQATTLRMVRAGSFDFADRLRLEQMRIDGNNEGVLDVRAGGACHLRNCEVFNYNSGAGGSNALFVSDGICLVEGCVFEGRSGRAEQSADGNPFDLRGECALFIRRSQFIDNSEIVRPSFPCVFDGCTALGSRQRTLATSPGSTLWVRDSPSLVTGTPAVNSFTIATDDLAFVKRAAGQDAQVDKASQDLIDTLAMRRRLPYWIGLLRHDKPEVRALAAGQLSKLIGMDVVATTAQADDAGWLDEGSTALAAEIEFARLMKWFEGNRKRLRWDEAAGRYAAEAE